MHVTVPHGLAQRGVTGAYAPCPAERRRTTRDGAAFTTLGRKVSSGKSRAAASAGASPAPRWRRGILELRRAVDSKPPKTRRGSARGRRRDGRDLARARQQYRRRATVAGGGRREALREGPASLMEAAAGTSGPVLDRNCRYCPAGRPRRPRSRWIIRRRRARCAAPGTRAPRFHHATARWLVRVRRRRRGRGAPASLAAARQHRLALRPLKRMRSSSLRQHNASYDEKS